MEDPVLSIGGTKPLKMETETETETEPDRSTQPDNPDQGPGETVCLDKRCSRTEDTVGRTTGSPQPSEPDVDQDARGPPPPPEDAVDQDTRGPPLSPGEAVDQDTRGAPPPPEDAVDQDTRGPPPLPEDAVDHSARGLPPSSEDAVDDSTRGLPPQSKDAVDHSTRGLPPPSEDAVDHSTRGLPPPSEDAVAQETRGTPLPLECSVDHPTRELPLPSEDAVDYSRRGSFLPSEDAVVHETMVSSIPPEIDIDQGKVETPLPPEDAVDQGTTETPLPPEDAVDQDKYLDRRCSCVQSSEPSGPGEPSEQDVNNNVVPSSPAALPRPLDDDDVGEGEKTSSPPPSEDTDSDGSGDQSPSRQQPDGTDRRLDGQTSPPPQPQPTPGDADDLYEGVGGLLGAQPSEAELITALRRHSCWVCGATAPSHDANISHMLTHLQTAAAAAAAAAAPDASVGPTHALPPLPSLLLPPPAFMDSTSSADFAANPVMDTFNPFVFGDDDCQSFPELRSFDSVLPESSRRPLPALLPLRLIDESIRVLQGGARDGADLSPLTPPPPSTPPLQSTPPPTWHPESEMSFFKDPPRFSYSGTKMTARVVRQQPVFTLDENANLDLDLDMVGMKLRPRVSPNGKQIGADINDDVTDGGDEDDQDDGSLVCAICLKTFDDRDTLMQHVKSEVQVLGLQAKRGRKPKGKPLARSPVIVTPSSRAANKTTDDEAEGGQHACKRCPKMFARRLALRLHVAADHPRIPSAAAPKQAHVKGKAKGLKGDERPHLCPVCHKRFRRRAHLEQHRMVHSGERPFVCAHCGTAFRRKDRLVVHVRTHLFAGRARSGAAFKDRVAAEAASKAKQAAGEAEGDARSKAKASSPKSRASSGAAVSVRVETPSGIAVPKTRTKARSGAVLEAKVSALSAKAAAASASAAPPAAVSEAGRGFGCVTCGAAYPLKGRLRRHVLACHAPAMPHVCLTCGKDCVTRRLLLGHVERHIEERVRERGSKVQQHAEDGLPMDAAAEDVAAEDGPPMDVAVEDVAAEEGLLLDVDADAAVSASGIVPDQSSTKDTEPKEATTASEDAVRNDGADTALNCQGGDNPAGAVDQPAIAKQPSKIVFKIVSKSGNKDAASVAAKFLPKLAVNFAATIGKKDGPKPGSKVVYMVVSKRNPRSGAGGGDASDVSGNGPAAGVKCASRVIFRMLPKKIPAQSENVVGPKTTSKLGFQVVPKVVPMSNANLEVKPVSKVVSGIVPLDSTISASGSGRISKNSAERTSSAVDPSPPTPVTPGAPIKTEAEAPLPPATLSASSEAAPGPTPPVCTPRAPTGTQTSAPTPKGAPKDSSEGRGSSKGKGTPIGTMKTVIQTNARTSPPRTPANVQHREPLRSSPRINPAKKTPQPQVAGPRINPPKATPQPRADGPRINPLNRTPQPRAGEPRINPLNRPPQPQADGRFLCAKCGRRFISEKLYSLHLEAHASARVVKTFECQCCGKKFLDKDVLRAHLHTHL